jgi:hypothetical protein
MPGRKGKKLVPLRGQPNTIRWIQAQKENEERLASRIAWASCMMKDSVKTPFQRTQTQIGIGASIALSYAVHGVTWATFTGTVALIAAGQPEERPIRQAKGESTLAASKPKKPSFVSFNKPCSDDQNAGLY